MSRRRPLGGQPSNRQVAAALRSARNNIVSSAELLGVTVEAMRGLARRKCVREYRSHIGRIIDDYRPPGRLPNWSPADCVWSGRFRKVDTDEEIFAAYRNCLGNQRKAAKELDVHPKALASREHYNPRLRRYRLLLAKWQSPLVVPLSRIPTWNAWLQKR